MERSSPSGRWVRGFAVLILILYAAPAAQAATVTVTGTGDTVTVDGSVTLREAIASVNGAASVNADVVAAGPPYGTADTIAFDIGGGGPQTIVVGATPLPVIARQVVIDGYTQGGSSPNTLAIGDTAVLNVILQGSTAGVHGLELNSLAASSVIRGLVLQGHFFALQVGASGVTIAGNFIGTDRTAVSSSATTANSRGINVTIGGNTIGGSTPADRNVISGNGFGITLNSQLANAVLGNYIGLNGAGNAALGNTNAGILFGSGVGIGGATIGGITASPGTGVGNVISGNGSDGIRMLTGGGGATIGVATIQGNIMGLDAAGGTAIPNVGANVYLFDSDLPTDGVPRLGPVTVGGLAAGAGNVLSGSGHGIFSQARGTVLFGNRIGTDITGTLARPNTFGAEISGGGMVFVAATIVGNVVAGNSSDGARVFSARAAFENNRIGTTPGGAALGNGGHGILVDNGAASIGDTLPGAGNVIANNGNTGVLVLGASQADILGNAIFQNTGLGINNSAPDLVTPNDAGDGDTGPNGLQNFPVITAAAIAAGNVTVSGTINSEDGSTFRVEIFSSTACDGSGFGEGATFLGAVDVNTDGVGNGAFGPVAFAIPGGQTVITATARNASGETSEFSACFTATGAPPVATLSIDNVSANEGDVGPTPFVFTVTLSQASATPVTVSYATVDDTATAPGDYLTAAGTLTFQPGDPLTQTITVDVVGETVVEPNETFFVDLSSPSGATLATPRGTGTIVNDDAEGPAAEIPTLSGWGALLLLAALALAGSVRLRSRKEERTC